MKREGKNKATVSEEFPSIQKIIVEQRILEQDHESAFIPKSRFNKEYLKLMFLSTLVFVFGALFTKFLVNLITTILLHSYSITFIYGIFDIHFTSISAEKWTLLKIFFVFTSSTFVALVLGLILVRLEFKDWRIRFIQAWTSFFLIMYLPFSLLYGVLIYRDFGVGFQWIIQNIVGRSLIASVALAFAILSRPFWIFQLLNASNSASIIDDEKKVKTYIWFTFIFPWLIGTLLICAIFTLPLRDLNWTGVMIGLSIVILPLFGNHLPIAPLKIYKATNKSYPIKLFVLLFIILTVLLSLLSHWRYRF